MGDRQTAHGAVDSRSFSARVDPFRGGKLPRSIISPSLRTIPVRTGPVRSQA